MVFFIILCIFLAGFILMQQGKGDFGLSNMAGNQMLFGGSGGKEFFERTTWILGALFIFGALGLTVLKSKEQRKSMLEGATYKPVDQQQIKEPLEKSTEEQEPEETEKSEPAESEKEA
jgi:protein translocase SecG subunit